MTRLVRLEPPYTRGGGGRRGGLPLLRGPRLARSRASGRWHRPRAGVQYTAAAIGGARVHFTYWCGQTTSSAGLITTMEVPAGEPLCGTCEGRAVGAGHPPIGVELKVALLFEPASQFKRPAVCPAARLYISDELSRCLPWRETFVCPVCEEHVRARAAGGWANPHTKIESHTPVGDLVVPCPFHRWDRLSWRAGESRAVCGCQRRNDQVS